MVELSGVHEDVIPSHIHAIADQADVRVFLNERCINLRGSIFDAMGMENVSLEPVSIEGHADWARFGQTVDDFEPDLLLVNTLQRDSVAKFAAARGVPILGVVHNLRLFGQSPECQALLDAGMLYPILLAPHVGSQFNIVTKGMQIDRICVIESVLRGAQWAEAGGRSLVVPCGVDLRNRAYPELLVALSGPSGEMLRQAGLDVAILGGGRDRADLEAQVRDAGLSDIVRFAPLNKHGFVAHDIYLQEIAAARALLPVLKHDHVPYRLFKITSALQTAVGHGLPVVVDRWSDLVYRMPAIVSDAPISEQISALVAMDELDLTEQRDAMRRYCDAVLARNRQDMARLIARAMSDFQ